MIVAYIHTKDEQRFLRGALSIGTFLLVWLGSIACPIVMLFAVARQAWLIVLGLVLLLGWCSLPVETNARIRGWYCEGFRLYWREASLCYEEPVGATATLLAVHPHGAYCMGYASLFTQDALNHVRWCYAHVLYRSPFFKAFTSFTGRPCSAEKRHFLSVLRQREVVAILPGGFEEAAISCTAADRVYLRHRKGWIKYALLHGYAVTPVFTFGERDTYGTLQALAPLRLWLGTFGMVGTLASMLLVFPVGKWWCPILPRTRRLHTVVGAPLRPPATASANEPDGARTVTTEQVDEFHAKYVEALVSLYDRHKVNYYGATEGAGARLEIW